MLGTHGGGGLGEHQVEGQDGARGHQVTAYGGAVHHPGGGGEGRKLEVRTQMTNPEFLRYNFYLNGRHAPL